MKGLRLFRLAVWAAVFVLGGFLLISMQFPESQVGRQTTASGTAKVGGPFSLLTPAGKRIDNQSLAGRPYIVFSASPIARTSVPRRSSNSRT